MTKKNLKWLNQSEGGGGWTRNCTHTLCVPTKLTCSTESSGHCHIMQKRNASYLGLQSIRCSNLRLLALLVCSNLQHSGKHEILTRKVRWDLNWVLGRGSEGILRTCSRNHWLEIARRQFPDLNICVQIVQWRTSFASLKVGILRSLQQTPLLVFRLCAMTTISTATFTKEIGTVGVSWGALWERQRSLLLLGLPKGRVSRMDLSPSDCVRRRRSCGIVAVRSGY